MRLTVKVENENNYCLASSNYSDDLSRHNIETGIAIDKGIDKLGQLEDILEEYDMDNISKLQIHLELLRKFTELKNELGIDLITLFKALKNGVYWRDVLSNFHRVIKFSGPSNVKITFWTVYVWDEKEKMWQNHLLIKDYGKSWALTKEELL